MGEKYSFERKQLTDYAPELAAANVSLTPPKPAPTKTPSTGQPLAAVEAVSEADSRALKTIEQMKLEKANAINELLSSRIVKKKGDVFDDLERDVRTFLQGRLATIFGKETSATENFSKGEVEILKMYCKQLVKKMETR